MPHLVLNKEYGLLCFRGTGQIYCFSTHYHINDVVEALEALEVEAVCLNVSLPQCSIVLMSHCLTVLMSHCLTALMSHCLTISCSSVTLSRPTDPNHSEGCMGCKYCMTLVKCDSQ